MLERMTSARWSRRGFEQKVKFAADTRTAKIHCILQVLFAEDIKLTNIDM